MAARGLKSVAVLSLAVVALVVTPNGSAKSCAQAVLEDWQDGRIDGVYAPRCYTAAREALPEDAKVYSTADADILRALQARLATARSAGGKSRTSRLVLPAHSDRDTKGLWLSTTTLALGDASA